MLEADGVSQADHSTEVFCTQKDRLRCTIVKKDEHSKVCVVAPRSKSLVVTGLNHPW